MTTYIRLAGLLCVAACGGEHDDTNVLLSVLAAAIGAWLLGYAWADVRAARDRDVLLRAIVRQIWTTPIPQSAALSSSRQACKELRGAIASRVANLEGASRETLTTIAKEEPRVEVASS